MRNFVLFTFVLFFVSTVQQTRAHHHINDPVVSPEAVVQKQLRAYNTRDIDTFLSCFSDEVEVYAFPDQLMYKGKEKMRSNYEGFFTNTPYLYCELVDRTVNGNKVKDEVRITRIKGTKPMKATIMYQIEDGLIAKMYFIN